MVKNPKRIGVVLDSTACAGTRDLAELDRLSHGLYAIVDLTISLGDVTRPDRLWSEHDVCRAMQAGRRVLTSQPTVQAFTDAIASLQRRGAEYIVILTLSAALSGTWQAAHQAASQAGESSHSVIDTCTTSAGLLGAARMVLLGGQAGVPFDTVLSEVRDWCKHETRTFFIPRTLTYLERGGRIGRAASLVGKALAIIPILGLRDGHVIPLARVRTYRRALERMVALATDSLVEFSLISPETRLEVVVLSTPDSEGRGESFAEKIIESLTEAEYPFDRDRLNIREAPLSRVITAHVGPGTLGIVIQTHP